MSAGIHVVGRAGLLAAFVRRDLLLLVSDRRAIVADALHAGALVLLFALVGELVDPVRLPAYGGEQAGYAEFAVIGALLSLVLASALARAAFTLWRERQAGTLEALLATPVRPSALHAGPLAFDALHTPLRLAVYLTIAAIAGLDLELSGVLPAFTAVLVLLPLAWGAGLAAAGALAASGGGAGAGATATVALAIGLSAGAYVPLGVLPEWAESVLAVGPVAIALEAIRGALIGGEGWGAVGSELLLLLPVSLGTLLAGATVFRAAATR
jgi:ABC-2 type transport system permease protein